MPHSAWLCGMAFCHFPFVILLLTSSQSLLLFVSCTGTLVATACGIEVISHSERDVARKIVGVFSADDIRAIIRPPLAITLGQVRGLEEEDETILEERLAQPCIHGHKTCCPPHRFIAVGVAIEVDARHPAMGKDKAVAKHESKRGMAGAETCRLTEEQLGIVYLPGGLIPTECR